MNWAVQSQHRLDPNARACSAQFSAGVSFDTPGFARLAPGGAFIRAALVRYIEKHGEPA